jgi:hypothetical protein
LCIQWKTFKNEGVICKSLLIVKKYLRPLAIVKNSCIFASAF